ncbi:MAG: hypothetical protein DRO00_07830 [Thermoproteota archaeon]|nr:MAG: hypothetical protein DRO00_07830 [Candidatus Korarchaeota archaeon]
MTPEEVTTPPPSIHEVCQACQKTCKRSWAPWSWQIPPTTFCKNFDPYLGVHYPSHNIRGIILIKEQAIDRAIERAFKLWKTKKMRNNEVAIKRVRLERGRTIEYRVLKRSEKKVIHFSIGCTKNPIKPPEWPDVLYELYLGISELLKHYKEIARIRLLRADFNVDLPKFDSPPEFTLSVHRINRGVRIEVRGDVATAHFLLDCFLKSLIKQGREKNA